ncbi:hypothetical protein QQX98_012787 [Neonectria punicea]|uniref:C3H1-type domain-containing protein n=1 Tax=Neonectria punicea TaxID=979145 RepID=A0ABR1GHV8_9HYPO
MRQSEKTPPSGSRPRGSWIYEDSQQGPQTTPEGKRGGHQRQQDQQRQHGQQAVAETSHRASLSPNWRVPPPVGDFATWVPAPSNYTLNSTVNTRGESAESGGLEGYAYCLDRGNGQYTRLVPADLLPPLNEVPARQPGPGGMVVLPTLQSAPPQGVVEMNRPVTVKEHIDNIVATGPGHRKKLKIYCDKWIHDGLCAFTQQGCRYKHEMPFDQATQHSVGLFQGLPTWWRKRQADIQKQRQQEGRQQRPQQASTSSSFARLSISVPTNQVGIDQNGVAFMNQVGGQNESTANSKSRVPPELDMTRRQDVPRTLSGTTAGSPWPSPANSFNTGAHSAGLVNSTRRNTWAPRK